MPSVVRRASVIALLLLCCLALGPSPASALDRAAIAESLIAAGDALVGGYAPERGVTVADGLSGLYFDGFEGSGLEADIGAREPERKSALEAGFSRVIGLAMRGAPATGVSEAWRELRAGLGEVAASARTAAAPAWTLFLESFLILIREGFEALLVVTAIAAYVRRSGNADKLRYLGHGVGWAVAASLLTALVAGRLLSGGSGREALEGVTVLFAAAVLFYVSCWLFAKSEAGRWQSYIQAQVGQALSGGKATALGLAAFLAVYREGAETVLFYQALAIGNPGGELALAAGIVAALICLFGLYRVLQSMSLRLPIGPFFAGTAIILYALSVVFVGQGILELQEARWVGATPLPWLPQVSWLGLFPTVESAGAQAVVLAASLAGSLWLSRRRLGPLPEGERP